MNILWVKAGGLVPPDTGGKIRSYNILRELAKQHSVTVFAFYAAHENDQHPALTEVVDDVVCLPLDLPPARGVAETIQYARFLVSRQSYSLMKYCRSGVRRQLAQLVHERDFDLILCDFIFPAPAIPWDAGCPTVVFTHNVEAVIWQRHFAVARNPLWKLLSWREWKTMERGERHYLRRASHVLTVSDSDRAAFARFIDPRKLSTVQTGVDVEYFRPGSEPELPNSLVFTGSMDWLPNEDSMLYFVSEILPLIRTEIPDVTLTIVGRHPSSRLRAAAAAQPNVELTGRVEDVRPYVNAGAISIVPLRIGGGTRLKIFEAMAAEKAVISTSIGAEGLPVTDGEHLLIADTPRDFADRAIELLRDPGRRRAIGAAARRLVVERYSWATVARDLAGVLERVVANRA